jgi:hypothetical protein
VTCGCPIPAADGHDFSRLIDELVPGVAADVVEGFENSVRQPVLPHELQIFSWPLSSGARGGSSKSEMLLGTLRGLAPCQPA